MFIQQLPRQIIEVGNSVFISGCNLLLNTKTKSFSTLRCSKNAIYCLGWNKVFIYSNGAIHTYNAEGKCVEKKDSPFKPYNIQADWNNDLYYAVHYPRINLYVLYKNNKPFCKSNTRLHLSVKGGVVAVGNKRLKISHPSGTTVIEEYNGEYVRVLSDSEVAVGTINPVIHDIHKQTKTQMKGLLRDNSVLKWENGVYSNNKGFHLETNKQVVYPLSSGNAITVEYTPEPFLELQTVV